MIPVVATGTLRRGSMPSTTSVPQQLLIALDQPPADILEDVKLFELLQAFPVSSCCDLEVRQLLQTRLHNCLDTIARLIAKHGSLHEILTAVDRSELDQQLALAQKKSAHAARLQQALRKVAEFLNGVFVVTLKSTDHEKVGGILKLTVSDIPLGMHEQLVSEEGLSLDADVRLAKTLLESNFIQILKAFAPVVLLLVLFTAKLEKPSFTLVTSILIISGGTAVAVRGEVELSLIGVAYMLASEFFEAIKLVMTQILLVDRDRKSVV